MKVFIRNQWEEMVEGRIVRDTLIFTARVWIKAIWIICSLALGYFIGGIWG